MAPVTGFGALADGAGPTGWAGVVTVRITSDCGGDVMVFSIRNSVDSVALDGTSRGVKVLFDVVPERRNGVGRESVLVFRVHVVPIVIDRRHPDGTPFHHFRQRLIVELDAVLDRIGSCPHGVLHARGTA